MTSLAAVEQLVVDTVAALGPILGSVAVLTAGIALGAVLGTVAGVGYRRVGRPADDDDGSLDFDLLGDPTGGRLVGAVAVGGAVAAGGPATTSAFAAVIRRAVAEFGPVVGGLVVVAGGVGVGAIFGTVVGLGYLRWSGPSADDEQSTEPAPAPAEEPSVASSSGDDGLSSDGPMAMPRRQVLGTVAAVGGAAALGGLGTSAFYTDQERFTNNQVVTGELDLKVDWEEHYSDWSNDETDGLTVSMTDETVGPGFPSAAEEKLVYVSDPVQFLANTAVEAFPDVLSGDDEYDAQQATLADDSDICDLDADVTEGEALASPLRTRGEFGDPPNPQTTEPGDPLVAVSDVKPGDFGEVTFSLHLCGNPGYVWLTGALRENAENGMIDPEEGAPGEGAGGELADAIQAAVWYDTGEDGSYGVDLGDKEDSEGDNFQQSEERIIVRGSLREVLEAVSTGPGLPLDGDPESGVTAGDETDGSGGETDGTAPSISGTVDENDPEVADVVVTTEDDRFSDQPENYDCDDYETKLDVGAIDGSEVLNFDDPIEEGESYPGCTTITVDAISDGTITLSSAGPVKIVSVKGGSSGEQIYVFAEPTVLDGAVVSTPGGGLSNVDVCCPDDGDDGNGGGGGGAGDPGRQCLENSTTAYVGFEWWVPRDVGSAIQTDSVEFDLGFYTEQCRHNDGSGFGNAGGGGGPDNGDDNGDDGTDGISFLAACLLPPDQRSEERKDVSASDVDLGIAEVRESAGQTEVDWVTTVDVDAVVAFQGGRFTTYRFESPTSSGTVVVGADEADGNPETVEWPPGGETESGQSPSDPCPDGYVNGDKFEF